MEKEAILLKQEIKICLPPYKMVYSVMFFVILSLIRGITLTGEIGGALDANAALLAVVFCAETYVMERSSGRWEIFVLYPERNRAKTVMRRLLIQNVYLCVLSYIGFFFFFWQKPVLLSDNSLLFQYGMYMLAVTGTILFWSTLSVTISNLIGSQWGGIGICLAVWMMINSTFGDKTLGIFNIFAYSFRGTEEPLDLSWLWGKALGILLAAVMVGMTPYILKKRG